MRIFKLSEGQFEELQESYYGLCTECGLAREQCEPDARQYECDGCGKKAVYGAEELFLMGRIQIVPEDQAEYLIF